MALATATLAATGQTDTDTDVANYYSPTAVIRIEKAVNALDPAHPTAIEDADTDPGRVLVVGTPLVWTYLVYNDGTVADHGLRRDGRPRHTDVRRRRLRGRLACSTPTASTSVTSTATTSSTTCEAWRYTSSFMPPELVALGAYVNTATVTGVVDGVSVPVSDTDEAHHIGTPTPGRITVTKLANGQDANTPGAAVYVKAGARDHVDLPGGAGEGSGPLHDIVLWDDNATTDNPNDDFHPTYQDGDANGNGILELGEIWRYVHLATARAGLIENLARVSGLDDGGTTHLDDDPSYVFGAAPGIHIEKAVNAVNPLAPTPLEDADALGNEYLPGTAVVWTYLVTNTGNIAIRMTAIVDDHGTPGNLADDFVPVFVGGDLDLDGFLDVGETWLFTSVGAVSHQSVLGRYLNLGAVTGYEPLTDQTVTDDDPATYFGVAGAEGKTPGFWKNNAENKGAAAWPRNPDGSLVYDPYQTIGSVFSAAPPEFADMTLLDALSDGGGGIHALLRQAVAALLSGTQPFIAYPYSANQVVALTNLALQSGSASSIEAQKNLFDKYNNYEADIDQFGRPPEPRITVSDVVGGRGRQRHEDGDARGQPDDGVAGRDHRQLGDDGRLGRRRQRLRRRQRPADVRPVGDREDDHRRHRRRHRVRTERVVLDRALRCVGRVDRRRHGRGHDRQRRPAAAGRHGGRDRRGGRRGRPGHDHASRSPAQAALLPAATVNLGWSGTAGAGDRNGVVATVSFAANQTTATVTITPVDDALVEGTETVVLTVLPGTGYLVGSSSTATATITDDDAPLRRRRRRRP